MFCCKRRSAILKSVEEPQREPAMDVKALLKTYEDDTKFVVELMELCLTTFTEYKESLEISREYLEITAIAHALKGCAGNLGCCPLQNASRELEVSAKTSNSGVVHDKVQVVLDEIQRVLDFVKSHSIYLDAQNLKN